MKIKQIHFAWDKYEDKEIVIPQLKTFKERTGWDNHKMGVYILTNYGTTRQQDLERIYTVRDLGYSPYVMIYNKHELPRGHELRRLQRWTNSRTLFGAVKKFEDFK